MNPIEAKKEFLKWFNLIAGKNYLSLFDGMSCFQIALKELGYPIDKYYAVEVDKFAIKQTQHVFPDTIQLGDVRDVDVSKLPKISMMCGGSPCTDLSFAGKQSGLIMDTFEQYMELRGEYLKTRDENLYFHNGKFQQSILFWEYLRILKDLRKINPDVKFLLENVRMTKKNQLKFNRNLGLNPSDINSNLVSAQNRYRLYFTNIRVKKEGLFSELYADIPQPKDKGIFLKDILQPESEVDEKYYLSNTALFRATNKGYSKPKVNPVKTGTLNTKNNSGQCSFDSGTTLIGLDINKKAPTQRSSTGRCLTNKHNYQIIPVVSDKGKLRQTEKANYIDANYHKGLDNHGQRTTILIGKNSSGNRFFPESGKHQSLVENGRSNTGVIQINTSKESGGKQPYQHNRVYDPKGIIPALTAELGGRNNIMINVREATKKGYTEINPGECVDLQNLNSKTRKGRKMDDKSNCLMAQKTEFHKFTEDFRLRRLTELECSRLQTIPAWYEWIVSSTQVYRMLGNGFTVDVIKHILSYYRPEK